MIFSRKIIRSFCFFVSTNAMFATWWCQRVSKQKVTKLLNELSHEQESKLLPKWLADNRLLWNFEKCPVEVRS